MAKGAGIWAAIDPASEFRVQDEGAFSDLSDQTAPAFAQGAKTVPFWHPQHEHFAFGVLLIGLGGLLWYVYEGKPSGAKVSGNVGPLEGEVGGGIGED